MIQPNGDIWALPTASSVAAWLGQALAWDTLALRNLQWSSLPKAPNEIVMSMKLLWSLILLDECHLSHTSVGAEVLLLALRQAELFPGVWHLAGSALHYYRAAS